MTSIELVNPLEYFRSKVNSAADRLKIDLDDQIEFYLVNLLCEFIDPSTIYTDSGEIDLHTPLAIMLKNALESAPSEQVKIYKRIGDTSLYFSGYFQDYFNRKTVNVDYYISMGASAYTSVSSIMRERHRDEHFTTMYSDLANEFENLVGLISQISGDVSEKFSDKTLSDLSDLELKHILGKKDNSDLQ